jgi:hypothetical protein
MKESATGGTDDDIEDNRAMKAQTYTSPEKSQGKREMKAPVVYSHAGR